MNFDRMAGWLMQEAGKLRTFAILRTPKEDPEQRKALDSIAKIEGVAMSLTAMNDAKPAPHETLVNLPRKPRT